METVQTTLFAILFTAAISENIALYYFLGTCPLISISSDLKTSFSMGVTVSMVMLLTISANFAIYHFVLLPLGLEFLQLLFFILIISTVVQLLESFLDRYFPAVYEVFGIFLPLIAVNCAILGVSMFAILREYSLVEAVVYAAGSGLGWTMAICLIASIRRRINMEFIPVYLGKTGISMIIAAIIAMAFTGISGLFSVGGI